MTENIDNAKFQDILKASYQPQAEAEATLAKQGYKYDPELSTMESKVFFDPATNKPSIVYRGSTRVSDFLVEDPAIAFGIETKKQRQAKQLSKQVEMKYKQTPDTYGHSLGSMYAEKASRGGNVYTFNRAVGIADIGKTLSPKHTDIRTDKDVVSGLSLTQRGGKRQTIKTSPFTSIIGSHSTSQLTAKPKGTNGSFRNPPLPAILKGVSSYIPKFSFK
jgi:hypothetical protein